MNEKIVSSESEISFFELFERVVANINKVLILTALSLVVSAVVYFYEDEQFEFYTELNPPNELLFKDIEVFKSVDNQYDLDGQRVYDIFIFHLNNKEKIKNKLKEYISPEHEFIKNRNVLNYDNEIEKMAFDIKILQPVLDKDIARIRNTSLLENYALSYKGSKLIQSELMNVVKDAIREAGIETKREIEEFNNNFIFKKNLQLEIEKGKYLVELKIIEKDFESKLEAALNVKKKGINEELVLINKSLKLAEKMNIKDNAFIPLNITDENMSKIRLNIISNGSDEQFEKIYYLKGSDFLKEEKRILEGEKIEIPSLIYDELSKQFLRNKFLIDKEIGEVNFQIENLKKLNDLISNSVVTDDMNLFKYYITEENNIKNLGLNYTRLIVVNIILGFIFSTLLILFLDSYKKNKSKS